MATTNTASKLLTASDALTSSKPLTMLIVLITPTVLKEIKVK